MVVAEHNPQHKLKGFPTHKRISFKYHCAFQEVEVRLVQNRFQVFVVLHRQIKRRYRTFPMITILLQLQRNEVSFLDKQSPADTLESVKTNLKKAPDNSHK